MKRTLILAVSIAMMVPTVMAQQGGGTDKNSFRNYDVKTQATVSGTIQDVQQLTAPNRMGGGTHVTLKTDQGTFDVHVGPTTYLQKKGIELKKGDTIEVTGSKQKVNNTDC
jgi:DNA/RNA endonuclease YhcR with UshA esterase domain